MDSASQIIERIRVRMEDPEARFFSTGDFVLAYNDALDEISESTEINEEHVAVKRKKGSFYTDLRGVLPTSILRVTAVWNPLSQKWLHPMTITELDESVGRQFETRSDYSRWWLMRGLWFLGAYPVPADDISPLHVYFSSTLPHAVEEGGLVTGLSSKVSLPPDFSNAVENYMMYQLLGQKKETVKSMYYWNLYKIDELKLKNISENRMLRDKSPLMGARRGWPGPSGRRF